MAVVFSNNAKTTLASTVSTSATSITVVDGSVFPALNGADYTYVTLEDGSGNVEIVKVTALSSNVLTVVRAQDNTSARAFSSGDKCELRLTAAGLNEVASQADTDTNTTYSVGDGGLTQINFTSADNTKLDGIAVNANNYTLPFTNNSANWNTAYTYSQVGHLPLSGGTLTGALLGTTVTFSGNLNIESDIRVGTAAGGINQTGVIKENGSAYGLGLFTWGDTAPVQIGGGSLNLQKETGGGVDLKISGTTVIDSSRNLTNIGTISSGVITAAGGTLTGALTISSGANLNLNTSGTDVGDIVWNDSTGEKHRIWDGGTSLLHRYRSGTGYPILTKADITDTEQANWNTAYGWGNHASAGYVPTSGGTVATSSNAWGKVQNTTATGYSEFAIANSSDQKLIMGSIGPSYTNADWAGSRYIYNSAGNLRIKSVGNLQFYSGGTSHTTNLALDFATNRIGNFSVTPTVAGSSVWHAGNDGSGSGLDADLLDGQQGSYYAPKTGAGASGTWPISINGNAATSATSTMSAGRTDSAAYPILWGTTGSTSQLYSATAVKIRSSDGTIWSTHYRGSGNVGGTGEASHHPAGIYSNGYNWLYGTINQNGNTIIGNSGITSSGSINSSADVRAPIFYDTNNTGYYTNPASTSNLYEVGALNVGVNVGGSSATKYGLSLYSGAATNPTYGIMFSGTSGSGTYGGVTGDWATYFTMNSSGGRGWIFRRNDVASNIAAISNTGRADFAESVRAPIFYDLNNTDYFANPASTSNLNTLRLASHIAVGGLSDASPSNLNTSGRITFGTLSADALSNYSIGTTLENYGGNYNKLDIGFHTGIRLGAHRNYGGVRFYTDQSMATEIFAVGKSGDFVQAAISMRAPIFYDSNNTGYYVDPAANSNLYSMTMPHRGNGSPNITVNNGGSENWRAVNIAMGGGNNAGIGYGNNTRSAFNRHNLCFHVAAADSIRFHSDGWVTLFEVTGANGDGWLKGSLTAGGNITAYSDRKVKDNIEPITNALNKVQQLNGVTFNRIDLSDKTKRYGGLIAQDIEKVLPEAVDGDDIKRVDYNATIGLLVEAIKELKTEVDSLKTQLAQKEQ